MSSTPVHPTVPRAVDPAAKKRVLAAIKTVLGRLQDGGLLPRQIEYAELLGKPSALQAFIQAVAANRPLIADLAVDAAGRPVAADDKPLVCGISLAQIGQMLVYTCAKRMFVEMDPPKPPEPSVGLAGLLRRKPAVPLKSEGERKLAELKPYLAFEWQLPLLKLYYFYLDRQQLAELGRDLLLLADIERLEMASSFDAQKMRAIKKLVGPAFAEMLANQPGAMSGLARALPGDYAFFHRVLGSKVWTFYARDPDFVDDVVEMDRLRTEQLGELLADAAMVTVKALAKLPIERIAQMIKGFREVFGDDVETIFADPGFAKQTLGPFIERFLVVEQPADAFVALVKLKCTAMQPLVDQWLAARRGRRAAR